MAGVGSDFHREIDTHLEAIRSIPHLDAHLKKTVKALAKVGMLVTEMEELAENVLRWREWQEAVSSCIPTILAEESYLQKHNVVTPPLTFTSIVHVETINVQ